MKCNKCRNKISALQRYFGIWLPRGWGLLSERDQVKSFQSTTTKLNSLTRSFRTMGNQSERHKITYRFSGDFLPLSVFRERGYSEEQVAGMEQNTPAEGTAWDPVLLCWTYRLLMHNTGQEGERGTEATNGIEGCLINREGVWDPMASRGSRSVTNPIPARMRLHLPQRTVARKGWLPRRNGERPEKRPKQRKPPNRQNQRAKEIVSKEQLKIRKI